MASKLGVVLLGAAILGAAGCGGRAPSRVPMPTFAGDAAEKAIELFDANKDGVLDAAELAKSPGLKAAFPTSDKVSAADIRARIDHWKELKVARFTIMVRVLRKGRPLSGATVTFVPESFLGNGIQRATGTTDNRGAAVMSVPVGGANKIAGVAPGFYRVEITKDGEDIPAIYNRETTLGEEVPSVGRYGTGIKYDLQY
jgi:hypothetical protein